jgi:hypothetical protein
MITKSKSPGLVLLVVLGLLLSARPSCMAVPSGNGHRNRAIASRAGGGGGHANRRGGRSTPAAATSVASVFTALGSNSANRATQVSSLASSVAKTSSLRSINLQSTTMTLTGGVYDLSALKLDHSTLTLSGTDRFIFNISSNLALNAGKILLANGAIESNILFNYTGTNPLKISTGTVPGQNDSVLHGILLALRTKVDLAPGLVVGEIISGLNSGSNSSLNGLPPVAAVPDGASTFRLGLIALSGIAVFHSFSLRIRSRRPRAA